jgi:ankyrin repeat protein
MARLDRDSAKLLFETGADVNAQAGKKTTALRLAKQRKNDELVKTLQAAGAE